MRASERLPALAIDDPARDGGSRLRAERDRQEGREGEQCHPSIPVWMFTHGCGRALLTIGWMHGGPGRGRRYVSGGQMNTSYSNTHPAHSQAQQWLSGANLYT